LSISDFTSFSPEQVFSLKSKIANLKSFNSAFLLLTSALLLHSSLVRAGDFHIFPVFRDGAAGYLNTLGLQNAGDLFVRQRL
jgi:hypothetical protein